MIRLVIEIPDNGTAPDDQAYAAAATLTAQWGEDVRVLSVSAGGRLSDAEALDMLNELLSAPEWPGASGMEDVCDIVRATGRTEVPDAPEWARH